MSLRVTFLGTGDYHPTQQRNPKSIYIHYSGDNFLFDIGEGTTRQMMKYNTKLNVSKIFLTGTNFDHIGGLSGLLQMYDSNQIKREDKLSIFVPSGKGNKIRSILTQFDYNFETQISEVTPGIVLEEEKFSIKAFETDSLETSIGYLLEEKARPGKFDRPKAEDLGVPPGPKFGALTEGNSVTLENGTTIHPEQVIGETRPGRKIVYTGDTRPMDSTIEVASHVDLLIHDSAFGEEWNERAVETGHSTALEAAKVADSAVPRTLVLMNISPIFTGWDYRLKQEAQSIFDDVLIAKDGLTIDVPYSDNIEDLDVGNNTQSASSFYSVGKRSQKLTENIQNLRNLVQSDYFEMSEQDANNMATALQKVVSNIHNTVTILGSFKGHHASELEEVKDFLSQRGYNAFIATDLPTENEKSLEQNIEMYMTASRFSVMIDRDPSGHLNEYEIARRQRDILARLVPESENSTYMVGGEEGIFTRNIKSFSFKYNPTEVVEEAVKWAEELAEDSQEAFDKEYPWR